MRLTGRMGRPGLELWADEAARAAAVAVSDRLVVRDGVSSGDGQSGPARRSGQAVGLVSVAAGHCGHGVVVGEIGQPERANMSLRHTRPE